MKIFLFFNFFIISLFFPGISFSQVPHKYFSEDSFAKTYFDSLKNEYGNFKKIPSQLEKPVLIALSYYPELKNTQIIFRLKKRHTPLQTRATWVSFLQSKRNRSYVITISLQSEPALDSLLFSNVTFNAKIGVIGHELAHVADFSGYDFLRLLWHGIRNVSPRYLDKFEFKTDSICIAHGLGYQLLAWSKNVRKQMNTTNWRGPDYVHQQQNIERYMNPSTIIRQINQHSIYRNTF